MHLRRGAERAASGTAGAAVELPGIERLSVHGSNLVNMAFATEHPVLAHSEYRAVDDIVRAGGKFEVVSEYRAGR